MQVEIAAVGTVDRNAGVFVTGLGKMNAPGQGRRFAPATSGRETALATERLAEGNPGCKCIGHFPKRQLIKPHEKKNGQKAPDKTAVKYPAGSQEIERKDVYIVFGDQ